MESSRFFNQSLLSNISTSFETAVSNAQSKNEIPSAGPFHLWQQSPAIVLFHLGTEAFYGTLNTLGQGATFTVKRFKYTGERSKYCTLKRVRLSSRLDKSTKLQAVILKIQSLMLPALRVHENIVDLLRMIITFLIYPGRF